MKELDVLKSSNDLIISRMANEVEDIINSNPGMSKDEILEIVNDLMTLVNIEELTDDIDHKVMVEKAFNNIVTIISAISL